MASDKGDLCIWDEIIKDAQKAGKPAIWYVYDIRWPGIKILRGAVCKDAKGNLGYSWAHKADIHKASRKRTREIAFGRAAKCGVYRTLGGDWVRGRNGASTYVPRELYRFLNVFKEAS